MEIHKQSGSGLSLSILRTLVYFDIFDYPLTENEIFNNSDYPEENKSQCKKSLDLLVEQGVIYKLQNFYSIVCDQAKVANRLKGNRKASEWMKKAHWFSNLISGFPYVRGVSVSGSLSKGFLGKNPDIDYFIITHPNRLWLSRTLLVIFKKIFLLNSYKYFCINYFIDSNNLEIEEKNLFTATEIVTMIPLFGNGIKERFFEQNKWVKNYYPNYKREVFSDSVKEKAGFFKMFCEKILDNRFGDWLDTYFMNKTTSHWNKKFHHKFSQEEFDLVFKSSKKISKHHPRNYQSIVYQEYDKRIKEIEKKFQINMDSMSFNQTY